MCLIFLARDLHPRYSLVIVSNRDEYHVRPTAEAHRWKDFPSILGGRDLSKGGTWLGIDSKGRWAAVTNFREAPRSINNGSLSRGYLTRDFLRSALTAKEYSSHLTKKNLPHDGFNLLVGDTEGVFYVSNRSTRKKTSYTPLPKVGLFGLSNHLLDTNWPKVRIGKERLLNIFQYDEIDPEQIFELLQDRTPAKTSELPDTGISKSWEETLSSTFIISPEYGTRSSTVILIHKRSGKMEFNEISYSPSGEVDGRATLTI